MSFAGRVNLSIDENENASFSIIRSSEFTGILIFLSILHYHIANELLHSIKLVMVAFSMFLTANINSS